MKDNQRITPPYLCGEVNLKGGQLSCKKTRSSNLELYRIVLMLFIIAHHYVVNSGVWQSIVNEPTNANSIYLYLFGAWGKVGINCFLMITGYFMCTSKITLKKFLKLLLEIYFYKIIIFTIFLVVGYETLSMRRFFDVIMPFNSMTDSFVSCFIIFFLTIPFLNILIRNLSKRQHQLLLLLLLTTYTILGNLYVFEVRFNYVTWFAVIYFIASYIRLYPIPLYNKTATWGWITLLCIALAIVLSFVVSWYFKRPVYFMLVDCNKFLAVAIAVSSFLWFKNLNIPQSKIINIMGGSTFAVLLIHASSDAMRQWLWKDCVDCVGNYSLPLPQLIIYSIGVVIAIFIICNIIDYIRIKTLETPIFKYFDRHIAPKLDKISSRFR